MKKANFAPAYVAMYPSLCEIARGLGYALAIHGTVNSDFDLIAIPWIGEAKDPEELVTAIGERLKLIYGEFGTMVTEHEDKPHGRKAWLFGIGAGAAIDLSIMPRIEDKIEVEGNKYISYIEN